MPILPNRWRSRKSFLSLHRAVITVNGIMERISCFREGYEGQNEVLMHRSDLGAEIFPAVPKVRQEPNTSPLKRLIRPVPAIDMVITGQVSSFFALQVAERRVSTSSVLSFAHSPPPRI